VYEKQDFTNDHYRDNPSHCGDNSLFLGRLLVVGQVPLFVAASVTPANSWGSAVLSNRRLSLASTCECFLQCLAWFGPGSMARKSLCSKHKCRLGSQIHFSSFSLFNSNCSKILGSLCNFGRPWLSHCVACTAGHCGRTLDRTPAQVMPLWAVRQSYPKQLFSKGPVVWNGRVLF
jgi:hypothetical protein